MHACRYFSSTCSFSSREIEQVEYTTTPPDGEWQSTASTAARSNSYVYMYVCKQGYVRTFPPTHIYENGCDMVEIFQNALYHCRKYIPTHMQYIRTHIHTKHKPSADERCGGCPSPCAGSWHSGLERSHQVPSTERPATLGQRLLPHNTYKHYVSDSFKSFIISIYVRT